MAISCRRGDQETTPTIGHELAERSRMWGAIGRFLFDRTRWLRNGNPCARWRTNHPTEITMANASAQLTAIRRYDAPRATSMHRVKHFENSRAVGQRLQAARSRTALMGVMSRSMTGPTSASTAGKEHAHVGQPQQHAVVFNREGSRPSHHTRILRRCPARTTEAGTSLKIVASFRMFIGSVVGCLARSRGHILPPHAYRLSRRTVTYCNGGPP